MSDLFAGTITVAAGAVHDRSYRSHRFSPISIVFFMILFAQSLYGAQITSAQRNPVPPLPPRHCVGARQTPLISDCVELYTGLFFAATLPGGDVEKRYGEHEQDTTTTMHLPKSYYVGRAPRPGEPTEINTCELFLGPYPRPPLPEWDQFDLSAVAMVGRGLVAECLLKEASTGFDFPGRYGTVFELLRRYTPPGGLATGNSDGQGSESNQQRPWSRMWNVTVGNETLQLYESDAPSMMLSDLQGNESSPQTS